MARIDPWMVQLLPIGLPLLIAVVALLAFRREIAAWRLARRGGVPIEFAIFIGMKLRRTNGLRLVRVMLKARDAGVHLSIDRLEVQSLTGADVEAIVDAAIARHQKGLPPDWDGLLSCDLAGRDVRQIVAAGVDPSTVVGSSRYGDRFRKS